MDLLSYQLSKKYTDNKIKSSYSVGITKKVVESLPKAGEDDVMYLVKNQTGTEVFYDEYFWIDGKFDLIGSTQVDLADYQKIEDDGLDTTNKTIVGAINEVNSTFSNLGDLAAKDKVSEADLDTSVAQKLSSIDSKVSKLDSAAAPGTYAKVTINSDGLVTAGGDLAAEDIPTIDTSKVDGLSAELAAKQNSTDNSLATNSKTIVGAINELKNSGGGSSITVDTELSSSSENPVQNKILTAEIDSIKQVMSGVYKYKGSVNYLSNLPNSDKVAHIRLAQSQSIIYKLPAAPSTAKAVRISLKYPSETYRQLTFVFKDMNNVEIGRKSEYIGGTNYYNKDIVINDLDLTKLDTVTLANTLNGGTVIDFYLDKLFYINEAGQNIGTIIDFDFVSFNDTKAGAYIVSCVSNVLEYKGETIEIESGEVWNIISTDDNYAWNGLEWDRLGGTIDLTKYQVRNDLNLKTSNKTIVGAINELYELILSQGV